MHRYFSFAFALILLCMVIRGNCQLPGIILPFDSTSGKVTYSKVIEVEGAKHGEIFVSLRKWCVDAFISSEAAIEFEDKEAGIIAGKSRLPVYVSTMSGKLEDHFLFTFEIKVKDGRFKYIFSNFKYKNTSSNALFDYGTAEDMYFTDRGKGYQKVFTDLLSQMDTFMKNTCQSLESQPSKIKSGSDW